MSPLTPGPHRRYPGRLSHDFDAQVADQFDAAVHVDETSAVEPLGLTPGWVRGEAPETYPSGM